jgi:hypothetical protein
MFSDKQLTGVEATISKLGADGRSKGEVVASFSGHWDGAIAQTAGAPVAPLVAGCGGAAAAALAAAGAPFLDVTKLAVAPKWASIISQRRAEPSRAAQSRAGPHRAEQSRAETRRAVRRNPPCARTCARGCSHAARVRQAERSRGFAENARGSRGARARQRLRA